MATIRFLGDDFEAKPLTLTQKLDHQSYMRLEVMKEVKAHMVGLPLELCKHAWDKARDEVNKIVLGTPQYEIACLNYKSLAYALYLSVSQTVKDFKLENAIEVLGADVEGVFRIIYADILGLITFPKEPK